MNEQLNGKIITFYSYKGGTGRSMGLANVAWILAASGKRVLAVDWDLEAPGLHRYFEPFLTDKDLTQTPGVMDFILDFATAAVAHAPGVAAADWYLPYANLVSHSVPVNWDFGAGCLDLVPAGRQDAAYATRVNSFDWRQFYERLGGGVLLETVKAQLRERYHYILIDSRTGVSDTAGVCTVQLPDELVICFTLNRQSTLGASMAAMSALAQRRKPKAAPDLKIWPVPMRVETTSEQKRLEMARTLARTRFSATLRHLGAQEEDNYWSDMEVPYFPYYAFDETLAVFADSVGSSSSFLSSMQKLARRLAQTPIDKVAMDERKREEGLRRFQVRSANDRIEELLLLADEYEYLRDSLPGGNARTYLMTGVINRAMLIAGQQDVGTVAERLFRMDRPGPRVIGLALARKEPMRSHIDMAVQAISNRKSPFEQYHALSLVRDLLPKLDPTAVAKTLATIRNEMKRTIIASDPSRYQLAMALLQSQGSYAGDRPPAQALIHMTAVDNIEYPLIECQVLASIIRYTDPDEQHGDFVGTRGSHTLNVPSLFRIGQILVTNELFQQFVLSGGYLEKKYWDVPQSFYKRFLTRDGKSFGPALWPSAKQLPDGETNYPVRGICRAEARAFVRWCNVVSGEQGWTWTLPPEDIWELAARTESGLTYPWGDAFDTARCNSAEAGIGTATAVNAYKIGSSRSGCWDMAGNVWEFVEAKDAPSLGCVLRGGSYKNNSYEVRSYLRLFGVPPTHRPDDFGFRLAQAPSGYPPEAPITPAGDFLPA
jgi:formylglycine-generating enzyme required for sulfatase activity/cellulose biosynthesis protein BcsQ